MHRNWSYILMVVATLLGVVALVWPSPEVYTIAPIEAPQVAKAAPAARPDGAAKPARNQPKPPAARTPEEPPVAKRVPPQNTTVRRQGPSLPNGSQPNIFGKPGPEGAKPGAPPAPRAPGTTRPSTPPRPPGFPAPGPRPGGGAQPASPPGA